MNLARHILDFLFPPLCLSCRSRCGNTFFCQTCWELCAPLNMEERCRHCFFEREEGGGCSRCRRGPHFPFVRAAIFAEEEPVLRLCEKKEERAEGLAAFALYQWARLDWPLPDAIIPLTERMGPIGKALADLFGVGYAPVLSQWRGEWRCDIGALSEELTLLLLDVKEPLSAVQKACYALADAFPKKLFLLSLIDHDFPHS